MRPLLDHLDAINEILPTFHDGFFVESYNSNTERLVILGTSDISYHRDLVIACTGSVEIRFVRAFTPNVIRLGKHESGQTVIEFLEDGKVKVSIRGGLFEFECDHI